MRKMQVPGFYGTETEIAAASSMTGIRFYIVTDRNNYFHDDGVFDSSFLSSHSLDTMFIFSNWSNTHFQPLIPTDDKFTKFFFHYSKRLVPHNDSLFPAVESLPSPSDLLNVVDPDDLDDSSAIVVTPYFIPRSNKNNNLITAIINNNMDEKSTSNSLNNFTIPPVFSESFA
jgi:hypothetical protein